MIKMLFQGWEDIFLFITFPKVYPVWSLCKHFILELTFLFRVKMSPSKI